MRDYHGNRGHVILLRGQSLNTGVHERAGGGGEGDRKRERAKDRDREQLTDFGGMCLFRDSEGASKFQVSTFTLLKPLSDTEGTHPQEDQRQSLHISP